MKFFSRLSPAQLFMLFALALCAALGVWAYHTLEFYEEKVDIGLQDEARRNPFLAAGRLMERFGARVHFAPAYTHLPPPGATLFFPTARHTLSKDRSAALLDWVKAGGHLVAVTWTVWDGDKTSPDYLLDPLNFRQYDRPNEEEKTFLRPAAKNATPKLEPVRMPGNEGVLQLGFNSQYRLDDVSQRADWQLSDRYGIHALHYTWGKGTVIVLSDYHFAVTDGIAKGDHAALVYRLLNKSKDIWFIEGDDVPGLWWWMLNYAWPVVVSFTIILLLWLWKTSSRFGPVLLPPPLARRSMVEHVVASGHFLWQHQCAALLHQAVVANFRRHVGKHTPHWAAFNTPSLAEHIAHHLGMETAPLLRALDSTRARQREEFIHDIALLETVRKKL